MDNETAVLDWTRTARVRRHGGGRCITCGEAAVVINPDGEPQHKTCAEEQLHADEAAAARYYGDQAQGVM